MELQKKCKLRKSIARDVIKQLKAETFIAESTYGDISFRHKTEVQTGTQLKKFIKKGAKCEVCGIGALFLSYIRKYNNVTINEAAARGRDCSNYGFNMSHMSWEYTAEIDRALIEKKMKGIFSIKELDVIEKAFECQNEFWDVGPYYQEDRLIAICKNIIKNGRFVKKDFIKGTFDPPE